VAVVAAGAARAVVVFAAHVMLLELAFDGAESV
jgi:hypothetical protein